MKEIKKEVQRTETQIMYEAVDGTEFLSKEECKIYEGSARGVLRGRFMRLVVDDRYNEADLFGVGDDYVVYAVRLNTEQDRDTVLQLLYHDQKWMLTEGNSAFRKKNEDKINKAYEREDILLIGENCDGDIYLIDTRESIIDRLKALGETDEKD